MRASLDPLVRVVRLDLAYALATMALTFAAVVVVLELWNAQLDVPFVYQEDGNLNLMLVKGILENGSYLENPRLGAPFGQELYDYPVLAGDGLNVVAFVLLGFVSSDPAAVLNSFFLLTFPLVALTAFIVMRRLGASAGTALVCSSLYALVPYHFHRGEHHLLLSAYYAVPLAAYLILAMLIGEPLFARRRRQGGRLFAFGSSRTLTTLAICVVIASASGSFYYACFAVILVGIASLLRFIVTGSRSVLVTGAAVVATIIGLSALFLSPTLVHQRTHGTNETRKRSSYESEYYSLRLTQLILPVREHRIDGFANGTRAYEDWSVGTGVPTTEAAFAALGTIGAIGFVGLLVMTLASAVAVTRRRFPPVLSAAGAATVAALLIATMGGFSSILGFLNPQLRAWNRLSIFIAFFAFLAVAIALDHLRRTVFAGRVGARPLSVVLLAGVFLVGVVDQTTSSFVPDYKTTSARYASDREFARRVERRLTGHAAVFQLPYASFPESAPPPPGRTMVYDMVRPYLHTEGLRWSFGAMQGRPEDWATRLANTRPSEVVPVISALGFDAIYVDRFGFADDVAADVAEVDLLRTVGEQPLRSDDGRLVVFDLRRYNERLRSRLTEEELARLRRLALDRT